MAPHDSSKRKAAGADDDQADSTPKRPRRQTAPSTPTARSAGARAPATPQGRSQATPGGSRRARIPQDPINIAIYELRREGLGWDEIANRTNSACNLTGDHEITGPACYSRFFRNGPFVAKARGDDWNKEWYVHMKGTITAEEPDAVADEVEDGEDVTVAARTEAEHTVVDDGEETEDDETGLTRSEEAEVVRAVKDASKQFWADIAETVSARLRRKVLSAAEVKMVYDCSQNQEE